MTAFRTLWTALTTPATWLPAPVVETHGAAMDGGYMYDGRLYRDAGRGIYVAA